MKIIFASMFVLCVGAIDVFAQTSKTIPNRAQDQDLCLEVNDGGTPTNGLCVTGTTAVPDFPNGMTFTNGGQFAHGTWTTSSTANTNVASAGQIGVASYSRVGDIVNAAVVLSITPNASGAVLLNMTGIPVASDFTTSQDAIGSGHGDDGTHEGVNGRVTADTTGDRIQFRYTAENATARTFFIHFQYIIK